MALSHNTCTAPVNTLVRSLVLDKGNALQHVQGNAMTARVYRYCLCTLTHNSRFKNETTHSQQIIFILSFITTETVAI